MSGKAFFIDTTKCTACRGCQVACKQWNMLPGEKTKNVGSYQNPQDLSGMTYKLVRFSETDTKEGVHWAFFPDGCRHCVEAPCKLEADDTLPGAIKQCAETGAVIYTSKTKDLDFQAIKDACPYNIPRKNKKSGEIVKCTMCYERQAEGMLPACVKTCPTGTMNFGELDKMQALAKKALAEAKKKYPQASLASDDTRAIYLLKYAPKEYHEYVMNSKNTSNSAIV
ncbi:MAG: 4Fe-4S dicluster domain-containing protein [Pseudomonadota bacterium]